MSNKHFKDENNIQHFNLSGKCYGAQTINHNFNEDTYIAFGATTHEEVVSLIDKIKSVIDCSHISFKSVTLPITNSNKSDMEYAICVWFDKIRPHLGAYRISLWRINGSDTFKYVDVDDTYARIEFPLDYTTVLADNKAFQYLLSELITSVSCQSEDDKTEIFKATLMKMVNASVEA